jgi:hypothetical protein
MRLDCTYMEILKKLRLFEKFLYGNCLTCIRPMMPRSLAGPSCPAQGAASVFCLIGEVISHVLHSLLFSSFGDGLTAGRLFEHWEAVQ